MHQAERVIAQNRRTKNDIDTRESRCLSAETILRFSPGTRRKRMHLRRVFSALLRKATRAAFFLENI